MSKILILLCYIGLSTATFPLLDIDLLTLNTTEGISLYGAKPDDNFGLTSSNAGDLNADGIDDFLVGAYKADPLSRIDAGIVYVIFGSKKAVSLDIDLASPLGTRGFKILGSFDDDALGYSSNNAGDINGDGVDDLIIGAYKAKPLGRSKAGIAYIIFGSRNPFYDIDLALPLGTKGFKIFGANAQDNLGISVNNAGDINGDGIDDIMVGSFNAYPRSLTNQGAFYVIFGSRTPFFDIDVSLPLGTKGFEIWGANLHDNLGYSGNGVGDINGDKIDDLIVGAYIADPPSRADAGIAYVIFGSRNIFSTIDLASPLNTKGFKILGANTGDNVGNMVSKAGDINGDGIQDLLLGANVADPLSRIDAGTAYVIFGSTAPFSDIDLALPLTTKGFKILGAKAGDNLGRSASSAGDINRDGIDDLIVGAHSADPLSRTNAGVAYVIFGSRNTLSDIDLALPLEAKGFTIIGAHTNDMCGRSVSRAGDIDGDGHDDLIVGAYKANYLSRNNVGAAYLIYHFPVLVPETIQTITNLQNIAKQTTTIASIALAILKFSNPGAFLLASLSELLEYIRYLSINYPPNLQAILENLQPPLISLGVLSELPEDIEDQHITTYNLPINFAAYDIHSSFLVNFWPSITSLIILGVIIILVCILHHFSAHHNVLNVICSWLKVTFKWNMLLGFFIGYYGNIALYTSLEMRTAHFDSFLPGLSFFICASVNIAVVVIFIRMTMIIRAIVVERANAIQTRRFKKLKALKKQLEAYEIVFGSFKEDSFLRLGCLLIFCIRLYVFNVIIGYLFEYPVAQSVLINILGMSMLLYMILKRPFRSRFEMVQNILQELIFQILNVCVLGLAIIDTLAIDNYESRVLLGDIIIGGSTVFMALGPIYCLIQIILLIRDLYQWIKRKYAKKSTDNNNNIQNARNNTESSKNQKISKSPPIITNSELRLDDSSLNKINNDFSFYQNRNQNRHHHLHHQTNKEKHFLSRIHPSNELAEETSLEMSKFHIDNISILSQARYPAQNIPHEDKTSKIMQINNSLELQNVDNDSFSYLSGHKIRNSHLNKNTTFEISSHNKNRMSNSNDALKPPEIDTSTGTLSSKNHS